MQTKVFVAIFVLALSVAALSAERITCPPVKAIAPEGIPLASYKDFFRQNKIVPKTELSVNYVEQFKGEFKKFPSSLHQELILAGNKIHIMEGTGVTVDPTWELNHQTTFDGRPFTEIPGVGGSTARGYKKSPTRIVISMLSQNHGSTSLFLHEHGHSLDSINQLHGISNSAVWTELLASEPEVQSFLTDICGTYCTENVEEGFAELFANYHACPASQEQLVRNLPRVGEFFKRFKSTKNLDKIWTMPL
jgi:hypothetical protein